MSSSETLVQCSLVPFLDLFMAQVLLPVPEDPRFSTSIVVSRRVGVDCAGVDFDVIPHSSTLTRQVLVVIP